MESKKYGGKDDNGKYTNVDFLKLSTMLRHFSNRHSKYVLSLYMSTYDTITVSENWWCSSHEKTH